MHKIYVRPIGLSYGSNALKLIKNKKALPICGNKNISFGQIEVIERDYKNKYSILDISQLHKLPKSIASTVKKKIKICLKMYMYEKIFGIYLFCISI